MSVPDHTVVPAKVGERFLIEVESTPTTGYLWEAEMPKSNVRLLEHALPKPDAHRLGGGGVERFVFEAAARGQFTIRLIQKRPWETAALTTREYRVIVR